MLWHYPMCSPHSAVFPYSFSILPSLDHQHFSTCIFHTIYSYYILPGFCHLLCNSVGLVDILLSCCTLQLINKLLPCLFLCKSNSSLSISSCLFILIPITCCFVFMPYLIASSFLLNSFSYLIILPPFLTMPRWSFCLGMLIEDRKIETRYKFEYLKSSFQTRNSISLLYFCASRYTSSWRPGISFLRKWPDAA